MKTLILCPSFGVPLLSRPHQEGGVVCGRHGSQWCVRVGACGFGSRKVEEAKEYVKVRECRGWVVSWKEPGTW